MQTLTNADIFRLNDYVEKRKREIRSSPNIAPHDIAGATYYVSKDWGCCLSCSVGFGVVNGLGGVCIRRKGAGTYDVFSSHSTDSWTACVGGGMGLKRGCRFF